tara:strand:- start:1894 stop:2379 length:486 start_codon:yes stop_codon:yes gene_type:complete
MACLAHNSMIDTFESLFDLNPTMVFVQDLQPGVVVRTPQKLAKVKRVVAQPTGGLWNLCRHLGLSADENQVVSVHGEWKQLGSVSVATTQVCPFIYTIVLDSDEHMGVFVDGCVCLAPGNSSHSSAPRVVPPQVNRRAKAFIPRQGVIPSGLPPQGVVSYL